MTFLINFLWGNNSAIEQRPTIKLSTSLREETQAIHTAVEKHPFVTKILAGDLTAAQYHQHLVDLVEVYRTLERECQLNFSIAPALKTIYFEELCRESYLKQDIESFSQLKTSPSPAAQAYVQRLMELSNQKPLLLAAHAYVRYLGDLSGGMALKKAIEKKWPNATQFYNFSSLLEKYQKKTGWIFKEFFKEKLDLLSLSDNESKAFILEAHRAFELSGALFEAIIPNSN